MNHSFKIFDTAKIKRKTEWELLNRIPGIDIIPPSIYQLNIDFSNLMYIPFIALLLVMFLFLLLPMMATFLIMTLLCFLVIGLFKLKAKSISKDENLITIKDFLGNIHFLDDSFQIISSDKEHNHQVPYKKVHALTICFKEIKESINLVIIRWNIATKNYQYTFEINSEDEKNKLKEILTNLYNQGISINEMDQYGKPLYILNLTEKAVQIPEEYVRLINEIGDKET